LIRVDALRLTKLFRDAYGGDALLLTELLFHGETMISADELFDYRIFDRRQIMKLWYRNTEA